MQDNPKNPLRIKPAPLNQRPAPTNTHKEPPPKKLQDKLPTAEKLETDKLLQELAKANAKIKEAEARAASAEARAAATEARAASAEAKAAAAAEKTMPSQSQQPSASLTPPSPPPPPPPPPPDFRPAPSPPGQRSPTDQTRQNTSPNTALLGDIQKGVRLKRVSDPQPRSPAEETNWMQAALDKKFRHTKQDIISDIASAGKALLRGISESTSSRPPSTQYNKKEGHAL